MDIPDLDELEWLESHAQDDDQFDDDFELDVEPPSPPSSPPSSPSLDKPPQRPPLSLPPKPSLQVNPISKKRPGSDLLSSISLDETPNRCLNSNGTNGKRIRSGEDESRSDKVAPPDCPDVSEENKEGSDDDEEWLRFSPPQDAIEEMEVVEEQERILSRFATEIDGDCVPITGLDGERVYAKIRTSTEIDEEARKKKLNFRRDNNGEAVFCNQHN